VTAKNATLITRSIAKHRLHSSALHDSDGNDEGDCDVTELARRWRLFYADSYKDVNLLSSFQRPAASSETSIASKLRSTEICNGISITHIRLRRPIGDESYVFKSDHVDYLFVTRMSRIATDSPAMIPEA